MIVAQTFIEQSYPISQVLKLCNLSKSSYYYKPNGKKQGRKEYAVITDKNACPMTEIQVVQTIKKLFENPFVDYGYHKTWVYLKDTQQIRIGRDMTYKIMKKNSLLNMTKTKKSKYGIRNRAEAMVPEPTTEFSYWEFDIKYVWVQGRQRSAQILTIIDVYSRWVLGQFIAFEIKKEQVISLFKQVKNIFPVPTKFIVRNDNGSQFIAQAVQDYILSIGAKQEFTKPATPQMNAHIEAYHSIMESAICQRFEFENLEELKKTMSDFQFFYNFERIQSGIEFKSPYKFLLKKGVDIKVNPDSKTFLFGFCKDI